MAARGNLRPADELVKPALTAALAAAAPPVEDGALAALACRLAGLIDTMPAARAATMTPQVAGQLVRTLAELDKRAIRRAAAAGPGAKRADPLAELRAAKEARRGPRRR